MRALGYAAPSRPEEAVRLVAERGGTFVAGGTDVLNLLRDGAEAHEFLVDVNGLALDTVSIDRSGLRLGALARLRRVGEDAGVARDFPVIAQALLASASPQVRNMATIGGNLLQRTRCGYFRDAGSACNKREPGTGCSAINGHHRAHAVLGGSEACIAVHPSDLAVSLTCLDATVHVLGPSGARSIPIGELYRLPGATPHLETSLAPEELITQVTVPRNAFAARCRYLKLRDRATFEFAVVSVAAALDVRAGRVRDVRLAFGGIGTIPWRSTEAEQELRGRVLSRGRIEAASEALVRGAVTRPENEFKVELVRRALDDVLIDLGGL